MANQDRITSTPEQMDGAPVIRDLPVTLILDLMASGLGDEDLLGMYPELEPADLAAVRAWATEHTHEQSG